MAADFHEVSRIAELTALRMALLACLHRASSDDPECHAMTVRIELDGFGQPFVAVELLGTADLPIGGFSL